MAVDDKPDKPKKDKPVKALIEKKKKELSLEKKLEALIKGLFLKPFARRLRYLYLGLNAHDPSCFVMGSVNEEDLKYGDPDHSIGMIRIKSSEALSVVIEFLSKLGLFQQYHDVVDMLCLCSMMNQVKWDITKITTLRNDQGRLIISLMNEHRLVSEPMASIFSLTKIVRLTTLYNDVAFGDKPCFNYPYQAAQDSNLALISIPHQVFAASAIAEHFTSDIKLCVTKGVDLLDTHSLDPESNPLFIGFKFAIVSGSSLLYMHCVDMAIATIIQTRCNVFLIPLARR